MKLEEIFTTEKIRILAEKKTKEGDVMTIFAPCITADRKNKNGRVYSSSLLKREISRVQDSINKGSFIGTGDHPKSGIADIESASHIVTALSLDEKGQGWAEMRILPTSRGRTIQTLIRNGAELGVSFRGHGTVAGDGRVESDYKLSGIDIVTNASDDSAHFSQANVNVYESQNFQEPQRREKLEKAIYDLEKESYLSAVSSGMWRGSESEYRQKFGRKLREEFGLIDRESLEEVEKHSFSDEQKKNRTSYYFSEAIRAGYKKSFEEWKREFPQLVTEATQDADEVPIKLIKETENYQRLITFYQELISSGYKGSFEEFKKEHSAIVEKALTPPQQARDPIEEEAQRIFKKLKEDNPDSSQTLESVKRLLEGEAIQREDKRLRKKAILRVNVSLSGSGASLTQEQLEKMVAEELENLKEERKKIRERNWEAYKRLLED